MQKLTKLLILAYFCLFPLGVLAKLPVGKPGVNVYLTDIVVGVLGLLGILGRLGRPTAGLRPVKPGLIFLFICLFSLLVNAPRLLVGELLVAGLYLVRLIAYFGLYLLAYDNRKDIPYRKYLTAIGLSMAVFGLIQYCFWPDTSALKYLGWDDHYYRLIGTFLDPGFTGIVLVLGILLLITNFRNSLTDYLLIITYYLALALTYSRASFLGLLGGVGAMGIKRKNAKLFLLSVLTLMLTLVLLPKKSGGEGVLLTRTSTIEARVGNWQNAWQIIKKYPLFGVGFNAYRYAQKQAGFLSVDWQTNHAAAGVDNSYLFIWATTGIFGLLGLLWLLGTILKTAWEKSLAAWVTLIAVLVHSLFTNSLFYPWVMGWLAFILASD